MSMTGASGKPARVVSSQPSPTTPGAIQAPARAHHQHFTAAGNDPRRLRNYEFSDLYLQSYRGGIPLARQLRCPPGLNRPPSYGVSHLPAEVHGDAFELWVSVQERWAAGNWANEFSLVHDGVSYRCALIDSPNKMTMTPGKIQDEPRRVWCLRRLPTQAPPLEDLGMPKWLSQTLRNLGKERGLLLICGPFSSGKSSTAGSLLADWVTSYGEIGATLEDPIEMPLAGEYPNGAIYQIQVEEDDFAGAIKLTRRWNIRYLLLQEIRTPAAASQLIHIATGGPMVMTTIHANSPVQALMSLSKFAESMTGEGLTRQMLADAVKGVLHQTLTNGRLQTDYLSLTGKDAFSIQHKIRHGKFEQIVEDHNLQKTQRANGRPV